MSFLNLHVMKKRDDVVRIVKLLILCARVCFLCYLIISLCTSLPGFYCPDTPEASMGSCLLDLLVEQLCSDQMYFGSLPQSKIHHIDQH